MAVVALIVTGSEKGVFRRGSYFLLKIIKTRKKNILKVG